MSRRLEGMLVAAALWPALLVAQSDLACGPSDQKTYGALGIGWYHCIGGSCASSAEPGNRFYRFSSEPRLRDVASNGPAGSAGVRSGDVLAAIDRTPVTVAEGGARLGGLKPGQSVTLTLRRDGRLLDATVTAAAGCGMPGIVVTSSDRWPVAGLAGGGGARAGGRNGEVVVESGTGVEAAAGGRGGNEARLGVVRGGRGGAAAGIGSGTAVEAGTGSGAGARAGNVVAEEVVRVAAPVRTRQRVGNVDVVVSGAPVRWHRDSATGDYVITTSTNTVRLSPKKQ